MRGRQRADNQPVHPIGTMLSGYSPFGGTPPPPQTHPAMAKIIIQPGIKSVKIKVLYNRMRDGRYFNANSTGQSLTTGQSLSQ